MALLRGGAKVFFRKKNEPVKTSSEALTTDRCADMLSNALSGYMVRAKPVWDSVMDGTDENNKSCLTKCYLAFQAGFYIEVAGRIASGGSESMLTSEQADFGMEATKEIFRREHGDGDRILEIAFHLSVNGHENAYQVGRREAQLFVRREDTTMAEPNLNTLYDLFTCISDGTYDQIVLS